MSCLCLAQEDLHPAHADLVLPDLCAMVTYAPTYVPKYVPTYFRAALNMDIPMHKGRSNKTIQANIKVYKKPQRPNVLLHTKYNRSTANLDAPPEIHFNGHIHPAKSHPIQSIGLNELIVVANSSKGSVMCSAVPNTNSPLRTRLKHVKLSPCPIEISPQHKQTVWTLT